MAKRLVFSPDQLDELLADREFASAVREVFTLNPDIPTAEAFRVARYSMRVYSIKFPDTPPKEAIIFDVHTGDLLVGSLDGVVAVSAEPSNLNQPAQPSSSSSDSATGSVGHKSVVASGSRSKRTSGAVSGQ